MLEKGETKSKCIDLYGCRTETTPRKTMYIDDTGQVYEDSFTFRDDNFTFREDNFTWKKEGRHIRKSVM